MLNWYEENIVFTKYIAPLKPEGVWQDYNIVNAEVNGSQWLNEIVPELQEFSLKYPVYNKSVYSAYQVPEINTMLKSVTCVVVTGVVAECCVLSTVLSLIDAGIYVIYLTDAISGVSPETEKSVIRVLEGLAPLHISIITTKKFYKEKVKSKMD